MNDKTRLIIFGALALIVILVTCVLAFVWAKTSAKPVTVDDSLTGYYSPVPVNGRSTTNQSLQTTTLLPTFDTPGICDPDSICVSNGDPDDPFCYCKKIIGAPCNLVFECAPSTDPTKQVYCNNVCSETENGNLFATCSYDEDLACGANLSCSNTIDLKSVVGECLLVDNQVCTFDEQCYGGKCDIQGNATSGICISRILAGYDCDIDYCKTGFGCDFTVTPIYRHCQPLITRDPKTNTASIPAQYGKAGSLCKILPKNLLGNVYECDTGLTCNVDHTTGGPTIYPITLYPELEGFGICQVSTSALNNICNASIACIRPSVCGVVDANGDTACTEPNYLLNTGSIPIQIPNINFCGGTSNDILTNGSSGFCNEGYECLENPSIDVYPNNTTYNRFCLPKNNHFCTNDPLTQGKYCVNSSGTAVTGSCTGKKIGVFLTTGNKDSYLGKWVSVDLPDQSIVINQVILSSKISIFEYMPLPSSPNPAYPMVRIIFYPNHGVYPSAPFFFYTEFSTYEFLNENYIPSWSKIFIQASPGAVTLIQVLDIKFTQSGNFGMFITEERGFFNPFIPNTDQTGGTNIEQYNRIYVADFLTDFNLSGLTLTYTPSNYGPFFANGTDLLSYNPSNIGQMAINNGYTFTGYISWDVDDLHNYSIVIGLVNTGTSSEFNFYYDNIPTPSGLNSLSLIQNKSSNLSTNFSKPLPNYVKYYTDNAVGPNKENYVYSYNDGDYKLFVNGSLSYTSGNNFIKFESPDYPVALATVFSKNYTLSNFNIYYMPTVISGDINIISVERNLDITSGDYTFKYTENQIVSYSPSEVSIYIPGPSLLSFISVGGFTNYMYSLMEVCEI
jgi:hypothetical protein